VDDQASLKKEQIIDKAIGFFSKNGLGDTKIQDLTEYLGIGKGTLYLYFDSKQDLLMQCIGRLAKVVVPEEVWEDIRKETDYHLRHRKRLLAFLKAFPTFCGILNLTHQFIQGNDPVLAKRAGETYHHLAKPLLKDLRYAINHGLIRKVDEEVISFLILELGEALGILLKLNPEYSAEQLSDITWDFVLNGLALPKKGDTNRTGGWNLMDRQGHDVQLRNITMDGKYCLSGRLGKGSLELPLGSISSITFAGKGEKYSAEVTMRSSKSILLAVQRNAVVSGESEYGQYTILFDHIASIFAIPPGEKDGQATDSSH
jgi:AcrR family transcriptional regulator